jgi:hypothetical protein
MVPVYQAEIAPKEIRGRVVSLQQWAITWFVASDPLKCVNEI